MMLPEAMGNRESESESNLPLGTQWSQTRIHTGKLPVSEIYFNPLSRYKLRAANCNEAAQTSSLKVAVQVDISFQVGVYL